MVALSALEAAATGGTRCFGAASVQAGDSSLPCRRPILLTHRHLGDVVPHCPRMTAFGRYEDGDDPASFRQACPLLASSNLCTGGISVSILARVLVGEGGGGSWRTFVPTAAHAICDSTLLAVLVYT